MTLNKFEDLLKGLMKIAHQSLQIGTGGSTVDFKQMHIVFIINFRHVIVSSLNIPFLV